MYQYLLFDLDGTLTNPKEGITKSVQYALHHFGIDVDDPDTLTSYIGPPLIPSFMEFHGLTQEQALEALQVYRQRFASVGLFENEVLEGVPEMLCALKQKGRFLAVASSKPEAYVIRILEHFDDALSSILVGNNLVWASRRHGVCRLRDTSAANENNVQILSRKVHGEPGRPGLLRALYETEAQHVHSVNTGRRYLLVLGDEAYEWNHERSAPDDPAWFYHTGLAAVGFVPEAGERLFSASVDGRIAEFVNAYADFGDPISKICVLPTRTLGSFHRFKAICAVLFTTCGDAEMDTQVTWSCDFAERTDPTNLTVTIPANQNPNRSFAAVFRRNPGFHSLRHLSVRLHNNTAGEDLSFVSAQIIYEYRGRQR